MVQAASWILGLVLLTGVNIIRRDCFDSRLLSHEKTWHNTAHTPTKGRPDLQTEACLHDTVEMHVPESPERIFAGANQAATFTWKTNPGAHQSKAQCSTHWLESASLQNWAPNLNNLSTAVVKKILVIVRFIQIQYNSIHHHTSHRFPMIFFNTFPPFSTRIQKISKQV